MSVTVNERAALRANLNTIGAAPAAGQRAWEREEFTPTIGTPWIRETLAPYASSLESIPPRGGLVENESLYLLDLFVPANDPAVAAGNAADVGDTTADAIVAGYWPGLNLTSGGQVVRVLSSKRAKAEPDLPNWWMIPITIKVRANTRNPE